MKLQQLRYFQAACKYQSITAAAKVLHISQPSISMAIRELESEFGVKLTLRSYQGFTLTAEGEALLKLCDGLLRHADQISRYMEGLKEQNHTIRLGMPPMIGSHMLPILYHTFLRHHPEIALTTEEHGAKILLQGLLNDTLDLALIAHNHPLGEAYESVAVAETETVWCVWKEHPLAAQSSISIWQLEGEPLVFFQAGFLQPEQLQQQFEEAGVVPHVLHTTDQLSTAQSLIRSRTASGFLLGFLAEQTPDLKCLPLDPPMMVQVSLVWDRRRQLTPDMRQLVEQFHIP